MMLFPIAIGLLVIGAILTVGKKNPPSVVSGESLESDSPPEQEPTALDILAACIREGDIPDEFLICEAVEEAYEKGDIALAEAISTAFEKQEETPSNEEAKEEAKECPFARQWESPIRGVSDDEWSAFVQAMKVDSETADSKNHAGAFRHKKQRLSQLGISDVSTPELQVKALATDVADCFSRGKGVIDEYAASQVVIDGKPHSMTPSGILAVMKAAGVKNAIEWIRSEKDKSAFPETTKTFLRANGCF